jgi:hypothetical protein
MAAKAAKRIEKQKKTIDMNYYRRHVISQSRNIVLFKTVFGLGAQNYIAAVCVERSSRKKNVPATGPSNKPLTAYRSSVCFNLSSLRRRVSEGKRNSTAESQNCKGD